MFSRIFLRWSVLTTVQRAFRNSSAKRIVNSRPVVDDSRGILRHEDLVTPAEFIIREFVKNAKEKTGKPSNQWLNPVPDPVWRQRRRQFVRATITCLRALVVGVKASVVGCLVGLVEFVRRNRKQNLVTGENQLVIVPEGDKNVVQDGTPPDELIPKLRNRNMLDHPDPVYLRAAKLVEKMINVNRDQPTVVDHSWTVEVRRSAWNNAFSRADGTIVINTGKMGCDTDDELCIAIGRVMAEVMMNHDENGDSVLWVAKKSGWLLLAGAIVWCPCSIFLLVTGIIYNAMFIAVMRHCKRNKLEADRVGLLLAARACVDLSAVDLSPNWEERSNCNTPFFLQPYSPYPTNHSRKTNLEAALVEAKKVQKSVGCKRYEYTFRSQNHMFLRAV